MVDLAALAADRDARSRAAEWLLDFPGPVGLVWGHRDPLMSAADFAALERELPYARIWRTEAGHFVQEEEPDAIVEAIEWTAQRIGIAADPEGIPSNFLPGIGSGDYVEVGRSQVRRLIDHAGLQPQDRILDVGCGLGRTARALRETMGPTGLYDGVDVVKDIVRWCQQNLTRVDPRLRFHHAPVRSGLYSPQGSIDAREYRFPFADSSFDFVVAESLFTHLSADEARSYLTEIGRVMRPGATLCVSVFLLDAAARAAIAEGRSDHRFATARGDDWIEDPEQPLLAVAFASEWFSSALAAAGLEPARPVAEGAWRGALGTVSYQDTIVAKKRP
jgi:SAM-dependent methyltransferase